MDQQKIWNYFQAHHPERFSGAATRLFHLVRRIPPRSRVLNIGVGSGLLEAMAGRLGHEVVSLDPDAESLHKVMRDCAAVAGRIEALPLRDECLDVVVVSEVLEHLDDATLAGGISEIHRVLRTDGLLLGTVPYDEDLSLSQVVCPDCGKVFHKVGHLQSFDTDAIKHLIGGRFAAVSAYRQAFMNTSDLRLLRRTTAWVRNKIVLAGLLTRDLTLVFSGTKRRATPMPRDGRQDAQQDARSY